MKATQALIILSLFLLAITACENGEKHNKKMKNDLILKLKINDMGLIGYGEIYSCDVLEVLEGKTDEKTISLTLLDSDNLISKSNGRLPIEVIVKFKKNKEKEPYQVMPIDGFVDIKKTSWVITDIKKSE